jgi:hypothetical protein
MLIFLARVDKFETVVGGCPEIPMRLSGCTL